MILKPGIRRFVGQTGANRHLATVPFWAPLKSSLALVRGSGSATFTRATTASVTDFEGSVHTALAGEARFTGARRVNNQIDGSSEDNTNAPAGVLSANVTVVPTALSFTSADNSYWYKYNVNTSSFPLGAVIECSADVSCTVNRTVCVRVANAVNGTNNSYANINVSQTPQRVSLKLIISLSASYVGFGIDNRSVVGATDTSTAGIITFTNLQIEDVTNQANQNPSEYVSVGVLAAPYHGAGVDGVQYFETLNGNTVSGNVVIESVGAAISDATLKGYFPEPLVTNYLLNSNAPATQTTGSLGVGTYCMWLTGAGSVAISAGTATITGAGSATAATPLVFQVTVAGTVTATVTAPVTEFQLENSPYPTSFILTAGAPVARNADVYSTQTSGNISAAAGTIALSYTTNHAPSGTIYLWGTYVDANNSTSILHDGTNLIFRKRIAGVNYDATIANVFVSGTRYKMCASWGAAGTTIYLNGTAGTPNANTTAAQIGTTMQFGADGNSAGQPTAEIRDARIWQIQQPATTQVILST